MCIFNLLYVTYINILCIIIGYEFPIYTTSQKAWMVSDNIYTRNYLYMILTPPEVPHYENISTQILSLQYYQFI